MRGKIVNLCIGFMNLLYGALIIFYTMYVPQDKTLLTVQEASVVRYIVLSIYAVMISVAIIDLIQSYNHRSDTTFNTAYISGVFALSFIFIKEPIIATFSIITGIVVLFKSLKENLVELNSTTGISVSIVIMSVIGIIGLVVFNYADIGESIKNKENKDELAYRTDYFKYVTELDITDPYINVKKDGKFGYINQYGDVVINFDYDYASPFIKINVYNKEFYIALVCKNGSSYIILKNERSVLSYRSESNDDNYDAKLEELEKIYKETLSQPGEMVFEIEKIKDNMNRANVYQEISSDYTFRYDYNDEYDLIVTQSNMGLGDKYEFSKKADKNIKIELDVDNIDYDSKYLYLYSNGTIPFFETNKKVQGWITNYGKKNEMSGKAQILDFFGERILLRDYNNNTVYFINPVDGKALSESYKDIFVCNNGRYIVKDSENFFKVIDDEYNKVLEKEFVAINPRLLNADLYVTVDTLDNIKFNDYGYANNISWSLMNQDGNVICDGIEQIYDLYYKLPNDKEIQEENYLEFTENVKELEYSFPGDKFYQNY